MRRDRTMDGSRSSSRRGLLPHRRRMRCPPLAPGTTRPVTVDRVTQPTRLAFTDTHDPSKPTVVFVRGVGGSSTQFQPLTEFVAALASCWGVGGRKHPPDEDGECEGQGDLTTSRLSPSCHCANTPTCMTVSPYTNRR